MNITDKITITNEDNMELMARYPDGYFDLAIVDPPYGIGEDGSRNKSRSKLAKSKDYKSFAGFDKEPPSKEYFKELVRVSKNQIIWGANHFISRLPIDSSCWIVWDKVNGDNDFADCELAYTSFKTAVRQVKYMWHGFMQGSDFNGNMQGDKKFNEKRIHPTQKPIALYKWLLDKYAKPGDKILDTHLGSGSIAIACFDYGYELTACELDRDYFDVSVKRIQHHIAFNQSLFQPEELTQTLF
ncbi:DNA methyltransferase [Elizabethkingia anophelis]|uniref:DNA methyltransferase n=1 Tax=Elizabethkingia anophelis TaxID=1117645 RepID=UPI0016265D43|nr:DNA methyltransferase [Elizabethkingia anophelis]